MRDTTNNWVVLHRDESCNASATLSYLRKTKKSYNYYIDRTGKVLNLVDVKWEAAHAGWSHYKGLTHWNRFSIGIAFQNCHDQRFTDIQYIQGRALLAQLMERYPDLTRDRIVRHQDIALFRGKSDPGKNFIMSRVLPLDKLAQP